MTTTAAANPSTARRPAAPRAGPRAAPRLALLDGEGALEVLDRARALERAGRRVLHLEIGEPDVPTPAHVVEAGVAALRDGGTRYGPAAGLPALREAIAAEAATRGIAAAPDDVVVTPGAKTALFYALLALVAPGDEVLVPDPGFPAYASVARFAGGAPVGYPVRTGAALAFDADAVATLVTPRTRVLVVNAPHNPTGATLDAATIARIADLAERHDLAVVSDEIYARLAYDADGAPAEAAPSLAAHAALRDRTVVVDGFSKTFAMTGWRLGHAILPSALAPRVATLAVNGHTCTPAFVQRAGVAALAGPRDDLRRMLAELAGRRALALGALGAIPGVRCVAPRGAFYLFPDLSAALAPHGLTSAAFARRLLDEHGVATLAGTAFGARGEGHLRLSFAADRETLAAALVRLADAVRALRAAADLGGLADVAC